jgi:hypothetical protein
MNAVRTQTHPDVTALLTQLLHREQYSLANYLRYAPPWVPPGRAHAWAEVRRIAEAQRAHAARIGRLLVQRCGGAASGLFPVEFTRYNDVSLEYLIPHLVAYQQALVADLERALGRLGDDAEARRELRTVLDGERKHRDALLTLAPAADQLPRRQAA